MGSQAWSKSDVTRLHAKSEVQVKCNTSMHQAIMACRRTSTCVVKTPDFLNSQRPLKAGTTKKKCESKNMYMHTCCGNLFVHTKVYTSLFFVCCLFSCMINVKVFEHLTCKLLGSLACLYRLSIKQSKTMNTQK